MFSGNERLKTFIIVETKKQEVIRKAYGEYWDGLKENIDHNGWVDSAWLDDIAVYLDVKGGYDRCGAVSLFIRPKSLSGIENNNGWISIESEDDFPKDSYNYWVVCSNGSIKTLNDFEYYKKYIIPELTITHYQPIIKPQPPIF